MSRLEKVKGPDSINISFGCKMACARAIRQGAAVFKVLVNYSDELS